jgi:predicted RNA-binding protein
MAKKFTFSKNTLDLELNGVQFSIDLDNINIEELLMYNAQRLEEIGQELENKNDGGAEERERSIEVMTDVIDLVLGKGATEKIMHDQQRQNLFRYIEILGFLKDEVLSARMQQRQRYAPPTAGKRNKRK